MTGLLASFPTSLEIQRLGVGSRRPRRLVAGVGGPTVRPPLAPRAIQQSAVAGGLPSRLPREMHFRGSGGRGFRTLPVAPLSLGAPLPHSLPPAGPRTTGSEPDPPLGEGLRLLPLGCPPHSPALLPLRRMGRMPLSARPTSNSPPAPTAPTPTPLFLTTGLPLAQSIAGTILFQTRNSLYSSPSRIQVREGPLRSRGPAVQLPAISPDIERRSAELSGPGPVHGPGALH
ncbi:hypothetical protein NDU88_003231 [Pleurodeles waltl]|uniref:Basic proline-rich protein-like n=1 Tax=Pleurodeles waltl TaxID=8319 RepID=A0AAV7VGS6_PLEWA|nr:hypothetical protein NDU88_003231 [Pleurodeles waltl]